jgi:hypothetical protein
MLDIVIVIINALLKLLRSNKQLEKLTATEEARMTAYILVPTLVILALISAFYYGWLGIDLDKPVAISRLRTSVPAEAGSPPRQRAVLIAEPIPSDYTIHLSDSNAKIWSSLTKDDLEDNQKSLTLNGSVLGVTTEFYGVGDPVAIVVDGDLGNEIKFRGKTKLIEDYPLTSKRSVSLVFWVMTICFLAYGMAVARGAPIVSSKKNNGGKKRAKPNKK